MAGKLSLPALIVVDLSKVRGITRSFEATPCPLLGLSEGIFERTEDGVGHIGGLLDGFSQDVEGYPVLYVQQDTSKLDADVGSFAWPGSGAGNGEYGRLEGAAAERLCRDGATGRCRWRLRWSYGWASHRSAPLG
jgi:hypothetical protein